MGSLFSGIGGFEAGFDQAGIPCVWQVEIDADARAVLAHHWPDVPRFEDVRTVSGAWIGQSVRRALDRPDPPAGG